MKLSCLFLLSALFSMQANDSYGQRAKITMSLDNVTVAELIDEIESKTEFQFVYQIGDVNLDRRVSLKVTKEKIANILDYVFKDSETTYNLNDRRVYLLKKQFKKVDIESVKSTLPEKTQNTVNGTVLDNLGVPLPGANVLEKGTTNGTQTDFDGNFSLNIANEEAVLVISYVGFLTTEVAVNGESTLNVTLKEDAAKLDEVVLVGYGKLSRENVTNSIASVTSKDIEAFPSSSVEQGLTGKLSGVQLSQSSGQPGAGISIRIRGVASISGGNEPLFVVDGTPFFSNDTRGLNGISSINPNDIESIQVLKDASSTAIYGSRGANGVVLITTKSGKAGAKPSITYSTWISAREVREELDLMSGDQFLEFQNQFFSNSGLAVPDEILGIQNANTDWQNEVFQTGFSTNHDLSLTGGNEKSQYYVSLNYLDEEGVVRNSDFERYSFRTNFSSKLNDTFSIKTSLTASSSIQNGFGAAQNNNTLGFTASGIGSTVLALPVVPVRDADGNFSNVFPFTFAGQVENPVQYADEIIDRTTVNRFLGNFSINTKIVQGLNNVTRLGVDYQNVRTDDFFPSTFALSAGGIATVFTNESLNWVAENYLEFKSEIASELNLTAIAGASLQKETDQSILISSSGFFSDELETNAIQAGSAIAVPVTNNIEQSIASAFGRFNLNYKDKYLFEASFRADGASVFAEDEKVATFPSVSAGWKLSNENFIGDNSKISNLKLRASWGQSGNPGIAPFQSLPLGQIVITSQGAGTGLSTGLAPNLPNRQITWETTTQTNIGLDLGLFDNRFTLSLDYYNKNTEDALTTVQLPPSGGFASIIDNVGEIENKGFELALGGLIVDNEDLTFSASFNISRNDNEVLALNDGNDIISDFSAAQTAGAVGGIANVVRVGEQLGAFLGFDFTGFDADGEPTHRDVNNDGVLNDDDRVIIGSPIPEILYGFNTNLTYKNFSFTTSWQGVADVDVLNLGLFNLVAPDNSFNRLSNITEFFPNVNQNSEHRVSQRFVENGAFFRLKNAKIGYNIPIENTVFDNINVFISGQNLITITDYTGFDPDVNSLSGGGINQGVDLGAFPAARSYTLGLSVKF